MVILSLERRTFTPKRYYTVHPLGLFWEFKQFEKLVPAPQVMARDS